MGRCTASASLLVVAIASAAQAGVRPASPVAAAAVDRAQVRAEGLIKRARLDLGGDDDPFRGVFSEPQSNWLFSALLKRAAGERTVPSPLAKINGALRRPNLSKRRYTRAFVDRVLDEVETSLDRGGSLREQQSDLLALYFTLEYLSHYQELPKEVPSEESAEEKKPPPPPPPPPMPSLAGGGGEGGGGGASSPPQSKPESKEHPHLSDAMDSRSIDVTQDLGDTVVIAETNFRADFFGQNHLSIFMRQDGVVHVKRSPLPEFPPTPGPYRPTSRLLTVPLNGETEIELVVPQGTRPLQPEDPRVELIPQERGSYLLRVKQPLGSVRLPLVDRGATPLSPAEREVVSRPVGIDEHEWPDKVREAILDRFPKSTRDPLVVAAAIAHHLSHEYLYPLTPRPEADPIEALNAGRFQCKLASIAMVGLLRDVYGIPARIHHGFLGKHDGPHRSFVVAPDYQHVIVEVYANGRWHAFDPTPFMKEKLEGQGEEEAGAEATAERRLAQSSPARQNADEAQKAGRYGEEGAREEGSGEGDGKDGAGQKDGKTPGEGEGAEGAGDQGQGAGEGANGEGQGKGRGPGEGHADGEGEGEGRGNEPGGNGRGVGPGEGEGEGEGDGHGQGGPGAEREGATGREGEGSHGDSRQLTSGSGLPGDGIPMHLENKVKLGSLQLEGRRDENQLRDRVLRLLLQEVLDPTRGSSDTLDRLHQLGLLARGRGGDRLLSFLSQAKDVHQHAHPGLVAWLAAIDRDAVAKPLTDLHVALRRAERAVSLYAEALDTQNPIAQRLAQSLAALEAEVGRVGKTTPELTQAGLLARDVPGLARGLLQERYGFTHLGENQPTADVAAALQRGELADLKLLSLVNEMVNFDLAPDFTPSIDELRVKQLQGQTVGREIVPWQGGFDDLAGLRLGDPTKSLRENLRAGTVKERRRRRTVEVESDTGREEEERVTILAYDLSPSITNFDGGIRARFQAALVAAQVARALADVSPSGKQRHRVLLLPFFGKVGKPRPVTSVEEAMAILRDHQNLLTEGGDQGTDIQAVLVEAYAQIADAQKRKGEPLALANVVLISDGESEVDMEALEKARAAIDRSTPVQTLFVELERSKESLRSAGEPAADPAKMLRRFAEASAGTYGKDKFFRTFSDDLVRKTLAKADRVASDPDDFYSEVEGNALPRRFFDELRHARHLAAELEDGLRQARAAPAPDHLRTIAALTPSEHEKDAKVERALRQLHSIFFEPLLDDRALRRRVVNDLLAHWRTLTGRPLTRLSRGERQALAAIVQAAEGR